jgi:hypothetical protein
MTLLRRHRPNGDAGPAPARWPTADVRFPTALPPASCETVRPRLRERLVAARRPEVAVRSMYVRAAVAFGLFVAAVVRGVALRTVRTTASAVPDPVRRAGETTIRRPRGLLVAVPLIVGTWALGHVLPARAVPVPDLIYEIESFSNGHRASLLNLPIGQPGAVQAPIPVDVDGDLTPDVLVSVNLVNVEGLFNNPPDLGEVLAPNILIERALAGLPLGKPSPPLRIGVRLKVRDLFATNDVTTLRFGYDTGKGGSIPPSFKATVGGLSTFFNPLEAMIDTRGTMLGGPDGPHGYEGPLTVFAHIDAPTGKTAIDARYKPLPNFVHATYGCHTAGTGAGCVPGDSDKVHSVVRTKGLLDSRHFAQCLVDPDLQLGAFGPDDQQPASTGRITRQGWLFAHDRQFGRKHLRVAGIDREHRGRIAPIRGNRQQGDQRLDHGSRDQQVRRNAENHAAPRRGSGHCSEHRIRGELGAEPRPSERRGPMHGPQVEREKERVERGHDAGP